LWHCNRRLFLSKGKPCYNYWWSVNASYVVRADSRCIGVTKYLHVDRIGREVVVVLNDNSVVRLGDCLPIDYDLVIFHGIRCERKLDEVTTFIMGDKK
jgi:hypothetical protein